MAHTWNLGGAASLRHLSAKQREVLEHIALHKSSEEIARDMSIAQSTVDKHLGAVGAK